MYQWQKCYSELMKTKQHLGNHYVSVQLFQTRFYSHGDWPRAVLMHFRQSFVSYIVPFLSTVNDEVDRGLWSRRMIKKQKIFVPSDVFWTDCSTIDFYFQIRRNLQRRAKTSQIVRKESKLWSVRNRFVHYQNHRKPFIRCVQIYIWIHMENIWRFLFLSNFFVDGSGLEMRLKL